MKRMRPAAALAAVALIVGLTTTSHAAPPGSGDAQGPPPFAACADIDNFKFSVGFETETQDGYDGYDPVPLLDNEDGEREKETDYVTWLRADVFLVNAPCVGADGVWGTDDDPVSFSVTLLFPKQKNENGEIGKLTLTTATYSEDDKKASFRYEPPPSERYERAWRVYEWEGIQGIDQTRNQIDSGNDGSDVCAEAISTIKHPDTLSDVAPDRLANGSHNLVFCEDKNPPASAKSG